MKILKRNFLDVGMKIWIFLQLFFLVHRRQRERERDRYVCVFVSVEVGEGNLGLQ